MLKNMIAAVRIEVLLTVLAAPMRRAAVNKPAHRPGTTDKPGLRPN